MSETPNLVFDDWIDWSNVDLLDACYDLMPAGMGLDSPYQAAMDATQPQGKTETKSSVERPSPTDVLGFNGSQQKLHSYGSELASVVSAELEDPGFENLMPKEYDRAGAPKGNAETLIEPSYTCFICNKSFSIETCLEYHAREHGHPAISCPTIGCDQKFFTLDERNAHARRPHTTGHGRIETDTAFDCYECRASLSSRADLLRHAKEMQHQPYGCKCGSQFSRLDVLNRHLESFDTSDPEFPCKYCKHHRGANGFRRKDHLMQHIRNYHHHEIDTDTDANAAPGSGSRLKYSFPVCSHEGCPYYRTDAFKKLPRSAKEKDKPFASQAAYTKHMREEHNESAFACDMPGCSRIGRRGYSREKDLIKHRKEQHPGAPGYVVSYREVRHRCTEPDCNALLDPSSLMYHYYAHDQKCIRQPWFMDQYNLGPDALDTYTSIFPESTMTGTQLEPSDSATTFNIPTI